MGVLDDEEGYDYHLGLTEDEKVIIQSQDSKQLSHFLKYDDISLTVETWARHMETGETYVSRRKSMSNLERSFTKSR